MATQAPPAAALIAPARRDSPRPAGITRSASGPRPKTTRLPSGIAITRPAGVVTCAVAGAESSVITVLPAGCPVTPAWSAPAAAPSPEVAYGSGHSRCAVARHASRNSGMAAGAWTRLAFSNRDGAGNAPGGDRSHLRSTKGVCATGHSRRAEVRGGPVGLVLPASPRPCTLRRYGLPGRRELA